MNRHDVQQPGRFSCPIMLTATRAGRATPPRARVRPIASPRPIEEPARLPQLAVHEVLRFDAMLDVVTEFHAIAIAVLGKLEEQLAGCGCRCGAGSWWGE